MNPPPADAAFEAGYLADQVHPTQAGPADAGANGRDALLAATAAPVS